MPAPVVKSYAKDSGKNKDTVEGYWDDAKKQADKKFKGKKDNHYWSYVNSITKKRSGVKD
jgi:hypothetical protein